MKHFNVILFVFFFLFNFTLHAQDGALSSQDRKAVKYYNKARDSFRKGNLESADTELSKALKKDPGFIEAWLMRGDISNETGALKKAIMAYGRAMEINPTVFPYAFYIIGNLEYKSGDYERAVNAYKSYIHIGNISEGQLHDVQHMLQVATTALYLSQNPLDVNPKNLGTVVNTTADEYVNFVDESLNEMYFTRKEPSVSNTQGDNLFKEGFFIAFHQNDVWDSLLRFNLPVSDQLNVGGISFSIDRKDIFFTGCSWPNGMGSCDIYYTHKTGNEWNDVKNAGKPVNTGKWDSQPFLSSDGKTLYFASKRSGGRGGSDIWMSEKQPDGRWGMPVNLGDSVNTSGNEMAPFIHADKKTLYFSSDTRPGLGGYDLFMTRKGENGAWCKAQNLGAPVNTPYNEINIFISMDASTAWVSSDMEGGKGGYDIYEMNTVKTIQPEAVVYVKGTVIDTDSRNPLEAVIELTNLDNNQRIVTTTSDPVHGTFFIPVYPKINYAFHITKTGYLFYSENMNIKDSLQFRPVYKTFALTPIRAGNSIVLHNIFFDFDSYELKTASFPELNLLVSLLKKNPLVNILIKGHTDNVGRNEYNLVLSQNRAKSVYDYLTEQGIDTERMEYRGYGSTQPVDTNETPGGRAANRRTEIEIR